MMVSISCENALIGHGRIKKDDEAVRYWSHNKGRWQTSMTINWTHIPHSFLFTIFVIIMILSLSASLRWRHQTHRHHRSIDRLPSSLLSCIRRNSQADQAAASFSKAPSSLTTYGTPLWTPPRAVLPVRNLVFLQYYIDLHFCSCQSIIVPITITVLVLRSNDEQNHSM